MRFASRRFAYSAPAIVSCSRLSIGALSASVKSTRGWTGCPDNGSGGDTSRKVDRSRPLSDSSTTNITTVLETSYSPSDASNRSTYSPASEKVAVGFREEGSEKEGSDAAGGFFCATDQFRVGTSWSSGVSSSCAAPISTTDASASPVRIKRTREDPAETSGGRLGRTALAPFEWTLTTSSADNAYVQTAKSEAAPGHGLPPVSLAPT
mmetsp:Transcript_24499/g.45302  ORF Transcript_24499/g.45302 Transcript_24499/m.45302 type:complete len:208 (+) Transcript_24499:3642-4265(+)